jgi:6,7-dimethyl-8-ribityllumazine synthase
MTHSDETAFVPALAEELARLVGANLEGSRDGRGLRVGIACARFNGGVTLRLLAGALAGLEECQVARSDIALAWAPGAFELPLVARAFASAPRPVDAVIALGAVIRGETGHYDFVAGECASGLQRVQLDCSIPVVFGVLTTDTIDQALERSLDDESNKGRESALTAVEMVALLRQPPFQR